MPLLPRRTSALTPRSRRLAAILSPLAAFAVLAGLAAPGAAAPAKDAKKDEKPASRWNADTFAGLAFRSVGPATTSGRISDLAVDPTDASTWFVAVASGGLWKTTNAGTTWDPVFDGEASYSIGCVTIDPRDPNIVWVGTGENNSQRSVAYGDGVYRSEDGGKSWTRMGLERSEHVGKIVVDPRDSDVVYVAAMGPLWSPGGDRGLYKTTDGGKTWKAVLQVSEHTGVSDVVLDPRDPDVLYAASYQRRRHVWTLINGGPESAIHKSTDGGATWKKIGSGLPGEDLGRIGLAISPIDPDVVYAVVEAANGKGGFFRSANRGANWEKRSSYVPGGPQYYNEIFADPADFDRLYSMDVFLQVSDDGGKTWRDLGEKNKHVDNHAMWIDPRDNRHYLVGCDGGLYESFDRGATWKFFPNLPVTQFYRVGVDDGKPFYRIYGGTQDNFSLGGPSRTLSYNGIVNSDWFVTLGGDGFITFAEPGNPDIIYAELQHGVLTRYDRKTGEGLYIQPQEAEGATEGLRWNWDSALILSPHSRTRLYFAAQSVFRSDDRGHSWTSISGDLTRQIDRNKLPVMGRVWSIDAVAKNASTSIYGNIVSLAESPRREGVLYVGTDDGLVQVSEDGGRAWRREEKFPGVPDRAYVRDLVASRHADGVLYAAFDNHKMGDFKPYLLRSADHGRTWKSIAGDLPERGTVYSLAEDPVDPQLLFAGTEFGAFFTRDGGARWVRLKGGLPTIQVRDIAIQEGEVDLVLGTFGRGFYVLDDYRALRGLDESLFEREAAIFPTRPALAYIEKSDLGLRDKGFQGETFFTAPNPPFGATFTYWIKDGYKGRKKLRQEREKELVKAGKDVPYPSFEEIRAEAAEEAPAVWLTIRDDEGQVVRRVPASSEAGLHRVTWDLRYPTSTPTALEPAEISIFDNPDSGPLAAPGTYSATLTKRIDGVETEITGAQSFEVAALSLSTLPPADREANLAFQRQAARLQRAATGTNAALDEAQKRVDHLKKALDDTPAAEAAWRAEVRALDERLREVRRTLRGDQAVARRQFARPPGLLSRIEAIVYAQWLSTSAATETSREQYRIAGAALAAALDTLRPIVEKELPALEARLEAAGGPWTPGRLPAWPPEP